MRRLRAITRGKRPTAKSAVFGAADEAWARRESTVFVAKLEARERRRWTRLSPSQRQREAERLAHWTIVLERKYPAHLARLIAAERVRSELAKKVRRAGG